MHQLRTGDAATLELGCGRSKAPAPDPDATIQVGVDRLPLTDERGAIVPDILWPLEVMPWAFAESDSCRYVMMHQTLEHLPDIIGTINEVWRVLDDDGWAEIIVPHYKSVGAHQDPTHVHTLAPETWRYFEPGFVSTFSDYGTRGHFVRGFVGWVEEGNIVAILKAMKTPAHYDAWKEAEPDESGIRHPFTVPPALWQRLEKHQFLGAAD